MVTTVSTEITADRFSRILSLSSKDLIWIEKPVNQIAMAHYQRVCGTMCQI